MTDQGKALEGYQTKAKELEGASGALRDLRSEMEGLAASRQKYLAQQSENVMAREELELLGEDDAVYKAIGPALVKQERAEALDTVNKRLDFIKSHLDGLDKEMAAKQKQFDTRRAAAASLQQEMMALQQKLQQMQMGAAGGGGATGAAQGGGAGGGAPQLSQ